MANPKKRMSPVRSANRRRNISLDLPQTQICSNCKSLIVQHHTCPVCGYYRGKLVLEVKSKTEKHV